MRNHKKVANEIRKVVLKMLYKAQTSHIGSNFSCIDILTVLYSKINPKLDKLVVSKGWVAASIYALNVKYGLMPKKAIDTYCDGKSKYIGLVEPIGYFGCEIAGGSMQMGLPGAVGLALAKKLKKEKGNVYVLVSDGELAGGMIWESLLIAAQHKLNNLIIFVDWNGLQAMGETKDILNLEPIIDKLKAFGVSAHRIDGHDYGMIERAMYVAKKGTGAFGMPLVFVATTIKGKGWKRAENNNLYHYKQLSKEEYNEALKELK